MIFGPPQLRDRELCPLCEARLIHNQPIKPLSITKIRSHVGLSVPPTACCPLGLARHIHFNLTLREKTEHHDLPQAYPLPPRISGHSEKTVTNLASEFSTCSIRKSGLLSLHTHCFPLEHKAFYKDAKGKHKIIVFISVVLGLRKNKENKTRKQTQNP